MKQTIKEFELLIAVGMVCAVLALLVYYGISVEQTKSQLLKPRIEFVPTYFTNVMVVIVPTNSVPLNVQTNH